MEKIENGGLNSAAFIEFDGMALPPFLPLREDAKKRFEEIRSLECRKDDVILAIFPKSGIYRFRIYSPLIRTIDNVVYVLARNESYPERYSCVNTSEIFYCL
jgi:hypothetical protein